MKMKQLSALLLVVTLLLTLSACGAPAPQSSHAPEATPSGDAVVSPTPASNPVSDDPASLIVGEWVYEAGGYTYDFRADGSGIYKLGESVMEFTYTTNGNTLVLKYEGISAENTFDYTLEGNSLNIEDSFGTITVYNKK